MPQTGTGTQETIWEGIITTAEGSSMHLRKNAPVSYLLNDLANMDLTQDNLLMLYTSAYLTTINSSQEDTQKELE